MNSDFVKRLAAETGASLAIAVDLATNKVKRYGDLAAVDNTDLVNSLFGDNERIANLDASLEGQLLPQMWGQGDVTCVVCKPTKDSIVAFFVRDTKGAIERYTRAEELCAKAKSVWSSAGAGRMSFDKIRAQYSDWFGEEPTDSEALKRIEEELGVRLPEDLKEISEFYRGGLLGGISHHAIAAAGPATNILEETRRIQLSVGLPRRMIVLAEPPASLIVLDTGAVGDQPAVIWLDATDTRLLSNNAALSDAQVWSSYAEFFEFLLDREQEERSDSHEYK